MTKSEERWRITLRAIRQGDRNQPPRLELSQQTVEPRGGVCSGDLVLGDQGAQDLIDRSRRLNEVPDACADVREAVIDAVAQAQDDDFPAQPSRQLIGSDDDGRVGRQGIDHGRSVSHESAAIGWDKLVGTPNRLRG